MAQGPSFDHFGDPYGYYMMTYGQLGSKEGAIATLKSPIFPGFDDNQCFHFHWIFNVRNHSHGKPKSVNLTHNFAPEAVFQRQDYRD